MREDIVTFLRILQKRLGLSTQGKMAKELGMTESYYKSRLKDPTKLTIREQLNIYTVGKRAGMDFSEVKILP